MAESEQHRIWGRYRIWSRYLQVGVKAPGTPNRMTFLPDAREWTETCWSLSSASKWARVPSRIFSPTAIGAIDSLSITGLMARVLLCWDRCCGAEMTFCAFGVDLLEKRERDTQGQTWNHICGLHCDALLNLIKCLESGLLVWHLVHWKYKKKIISSQGWSRPAGPMVCLFLWARPSLTDELGPNICVQGHLRHVSGFAVADLVPVIMWSFSYVA